MSVQVALSYNNSNMHFSLERLWNGGWT